MRFRSAVVSVAAAALIVTGCASGGGGAPVDAGEDGFRPRDNDYTQTAQLFLLQAAQAETPDPSRYQSALDAAQQSIAEDSSNPLGYRIAGEAYIGLGNFQAADDMLNQAVDLYPAYSEELTFVRENAWVEAYNTAIPPLQAGDLEAAIEAFDNANVIFKGRPEAMLQLASLYERTEQAELAIDIYGNILGLVQGPLYVQQDSAGQASWKEQEEIAAFNLAQGYARLGRNVEAVQAYSDYLEVNPGSLNVLTSLANTLMVIAKEAVVDSMNADSASYRMNADSAMAIYADLMARTDMNARDYFVTGIGLYNMEEYGQAAEAFRRSNELNSMSRDGAYNYAQSLFLAEEWENLYEAGSHLIELDPQNPNSYLLAGQGLLNTGEEERALEVSNQLEELTFVVVSPTLQPIAGGGASLRGAIENKMLDEGTPITIRVHFSAVDGTEMGTRDVTVQAGAVDSEVAFDTQFDSDEAVLGYWYEVIRP